MALGRVELRQRGGRGRDLGEDSGGGSPDDLFSRTGQDDSGPSLGQVVTCRRTDPVSPYSAYSKAAESITKPPLLQRSRLTGGGSPNLVGLVERKSL